MIDLNVGDISQEESMFQPQPAGNCMNWVLGHIVKSRLEILKLLGTETSVPKGHYARYGMGGDRLVESSEALPFDEIFQTYKSLQTPLIDGIQSATEDTLCRTVENSPIGDPRQTVGNLIVLLASHEAYHTGQTGLLRAMIGKERRFP